MALLHSFQKYSEPIPAHLENQWKELKDYWLDRCNLVKTEHLLFSVQVFMWLARVEFAWARRHDKIVKYLTQAICYLRRMDHFDRVAEQDILAQILYLDDKDEAEMKPIVLPFRRLNAAPDSHALSEITTIKKEEMRGDSFKANLEELEKIFPETVLVLVDTSHNPQPSGSRSPRGLIEAAAASPMIFKNDKPKLVVVNKTPKPKTASEMEGASMVPNTLQAPEMARKLRSRNKL